MKPIAAILIAFALTGCASTRITYTDGDKKVSFVSHKDYQFIHGKMDANGMEIMATGVDASTSNAITADVLKSFGQAAIKGARKGFAP